MAVSSVSYPMLLDLSRDECKRLLRHLELTAYEGIVSAFRAQGDLNQEKRELLKQLQHLFSISTERHRAEVRRAVNDETLTTIADSMSGPDVSSEWLVDGNRLVPLMPRLVPQTAFTITANQMANQQAEKNMALPMPSQTGVKEPLHSVNTTPVSTKMARPSSPGEVVILPGGRSIHIKGATLALDTEEEPQTRRRRRDSSAESIMVSRVTMPASITTPTVTRTPTVSTAVSMSPAQPMRITISKSPQKIPPQATSQPQKVILVSSANQGLPRPSLPKSVSAAISVHTTGTTSTINLPKQSVIMPSTTHTASSNLGNIITVAASSGSQSVYNPQNPVAASASSYLANTLASVKPRTKQFTPVRGRTPQIQGLSSGPVMQSPVTTLTHTPISNIQMRPASKPAIHIKQEGSMKIITQGMPGAAGKILPKPATSGVVVVTTVASSLAVTTKATVAGSLAGKVISVGPHGSKVIAGSIARTSGANVVTVNPKTLHLASGRILAGGTGGVTSGKVLSTTKPNVIVVQKSQARRTVATTGTTATQVIRTPVGAGGASFEKELVSYLQKQGTPSSQVRVTDKQLRKVEVGPKGQQRTIQQIQVPRGKAEGDAGKSSLLAELIQAVGIVPDGSAPQAPAEGTSYNQWLEMDTSHRVTELPQEVADASAVQMLLNLQSSASKQKTQQAVPSTIRPGSLELRQVTRTTADPGDSALRRELYQTPTIRRTQIPSEPKKTSDGNVIELQLGTPTNLSQLNLSSRDMLREIDTPQGVVYQLVKGAIPEIDLTNDDEDEPVKPQDDDGVLELAPPSNIGIVGSTPVAVEVTNSPPKTTVETIALPTQPKQPQQPVVSEQDIFSSALAEAQIDLNSYKYIEDQPAKVIVQPVTTAVTVQSMPEVSVSIQSAGEVGLMSILSQAAEMRQVIPVSEPTPEQQEAVVTSESVITTEAEPEAATPEEQITTSFIAVPEDIVEGTTASIQVSGQTVDTQNLVPVIGSKSTSILPQPVPQDDVQLPISSSSVEVLPSPETSQEALMDSTGSDIMDDPAMRASKRKRKPPTPLEDSPTPGSVSGWARAAVGLLQKVCRFRGANKDKNAHSASLWFLKPVDTKEVPDYYDIIKQPMDFMTVRRKLESGQYSGWEDFNDDMELIKSNAFEYNPEGHIVRQDAEEVFNFYTQEYNKTLERCQKGGVGSPAGKKLKLDRSPSRQ